MQILKPAHFNTVEQSENTARKTGHSGMGKQPHDVNGSQKIGEAETEKQTFCGKAKSQQAERYSRCRQHENGIDDVVGANGAGPQVIGCPGLHGGKQRHDIKPCKKCHGGEIKQQPETMQRTQHLEQGGGLARDCVGASFSRCKIKINHEGAHQQGGEGQVL